MKKRIGVLICLVLALLCAVAAADVAINEKNFPDAIFRERVSAYDTDKNGKLSKSEIQSVTYIAIYNAGVEDLTGVEVFTGLKQLHCVGNDITSLDISKNTALDSLDCSSNRLTSLDVSKNTALRVLHCSDNRLTSLDLSKNKGLVSLHCEKNQLGSLDVSNSPNIGNLYCEENCLTNLNIGRNTGLAYLDCGDNQLSILDISHCSRLVQLTKEVSPAMDYLYGYGWFYDDDNDGFSDVTKPSLFADESVKIITDGSGVTKKLVSSIKLNATKKQLKKGKSYQLKATITPSDAANKKVTWSSSNKKIATVSASGKVKAKKKGTCIITCTAKDGSGVAAECRITVK